MAGAMTNSAIYDGTSGLLAERDHGLAFQVPGESRPRFELPYRAIERIRMPFLRPSRITLVGDGGSHPLRLTGAVIDGEGHGESEWIAGSSPTQLELDRTRRAAEDTLIVVNGLMKIVEWAAADRVRRRRIRGRVLARG